ncbi:MAG: pseudouridine synthase [Candidatus Omnitrophota bacterium]
MKPSDKEENKQRLQVFLSHNGACSRRKAMQLIFEGCVTVNGRVIREPSTRIDPAADKIYLNAERIQEKSFTYILLHKPKGYITTSSDPFAKKKVFDLLPKGFAHLFCVGRLDKDTEGLLLLTNDGDLAYTLTHPKFAIQKVYIVEIQGLLTPKQKDQLQNGITIDGQKTSPCVIAKIHQDKGRTHFLMTIHEGRKRQIRRMLEALGHNVCNLKRIKQGPIELGNLPVGQWRALEANEIADLKKL